MPASSNFVLSKGYEAGAALTKKRFVKFSDDQTVITGTAGDAADGVAVFSVSTDEIAKGKLASVQTEGRAILTASEAIDAGASVAVDTDGKAKNADSTDVIVGVCDEAAADEDMDCSVALSLHSRTVAA